MRLPNGIIVGGIVAVVTLTAIAGFLSAEQSVVDTPPSTPEVAAKDETGTSSTDEGSVLAAQDTKPEEEMEAIPSAPPLTTTPSPALSPKPPLALPMPPEIVRGLDSKRQVIFTFDAGAGTQSFDGVMAALSKHDVMGSFFVTGRWAEQHPDLVRQMAEHGEVFNHTYSHTDMTTLTNGQIENELSRTDAIIKPLTGTSTKPYFRPPYGARDDRVRQAAWSRGYRSVYWTVDALDWKEAEGFTAAQVKRRILNNLEPGTIYMMHIGDTITGSILDEMLTLIKADGYTIVPLSEGL